MEDSHIGNIRGKVVATVGLRVVLTTVLVLTVYFVVPAPTRGSSPAVRLIVGLGLFVAVLAYEFKAILKNPYPTRRAIAAMATVIPLFVVVFASSYMALSASDPSAFSEQLNHVGALYFTVTTLATVGYGDIAARTQSARVMVMSQEVLDLMVLAVVAKLIFGAAQAAEKRNASAG